MDIKYIMTIKRISLTPEDFLKMVKECSDNTGEDIEIIPDNINMDPYDTYEDYLDGPNELSDFHPNYNGIVNASDFKRSEVKKLIWSFANIKINNFTIKIVKYHLSVFVTKKSELLMDVTIYEDARNEINNSIVPKRIHFKTDKRFKDQPWIGKLEVLIPKIDEDTVSQIIDHVFIISKLKAFI